MPSLTVEGWQTYYVEAGEGPPVVFLHGVGMDHNMWNEQFEALQVSYRVISYDMICHGCSEKPDGDLSLADFAEQLKGFLDSLGIPAAHLIGFSMGGLVAQQFSIMYPEYVRTLVLLNTVACRTEKEQEAVRQRVEKVRKHGHLEAVDPAIQRWFTPQYQANYPAVIETVKNTLKQNDPDAYLKAYMIFATADRAIWPELASIIRPVLVMTGGEDTGSTPEMAELMHQQMEYSELSVIPGYKHMLPIEGSSVVNELLYYFFLCHDFRKEDEY